MRLNMLKGFFYSLRLIRVIGVVWMVLLSLSPVHLSATEKEKSAPLLKNFDEDVAKARRKMRAYCAITQELIIAKESLPTKQEEAVKFLKEARALWIVVQQRYQDNPPLEYSHDKKFKARLLEISELIDEMLKYLEEGNLKRSFRTCGFACGLFVNMHEENGLDYALDRLFQLRKVIKTAETLNRNTGLDAFKNILPDLLQKRDAVFFSPCPWPDDTKKCQEYATSLKNLSSELDNFALAVNKGDNQEVSKILTGLLDLCNTTYSLAL